MRDDEPLRVTDVPFRNPDLPRKAEKKNPMKVEVEIRSQDLEVVIDMLRAAAKGMKKPTFSIEVKYGEDAYVYVCEAGHEWD